MTKLFTVFDTRIHPTRINLLVSFYIEGASIYAACNTDTGLVSSKFGSTIFFCFVFNIVMFMLLKKCAKIV